LPLGKQPLGLHFVDGGYSVISDNARVYGSAAILNGIIEKNARVLGKAYVQSGAIVTDEASVAGDAVVIGLTTIIGDRVKVPFDDTLTNLPAPSMIMKPITSSYI